MRQTIGTVVDVLFVTGVLVGAAALGCKKMSDPATTTSGTTATTAATTSVIPSPSCNTNLVNVLTSLGSIRSALSIYYGDTEGYYPFDLTVLPPKYIASIPSIAICNDSLTVVHDTSNGVTNFSSLTSNDGGGWGYVNSIVSPQWGAVFVNCTEKAPSGNLWISY